MSTELPAELVGTTWDTPEGRAHYARVTADRTADPVVAAQLYATARTLRWVAGTLDEAEAVGPGLTDWGKEYRDIAGQLETIGLDDKGRPDDGGCCVVCQEVVCDDGCPLAEVRA